MSLHTRGHDMHAGREEGRGEGGGGGVGAGGGGKRFPP